MSRLNTGRIFLIALVIFSGLILLENSFTKTALAQKQDFQMYIQIKLYDSHGQFAAYVEGKPTIYYPEQLVAWLEPLSHKTTITKDGKNYELLQYESEDTFPKQHAMGGYSIKLPINGQIQYALYYDHGSYPVMPGDVEKVYFTLLRQA